MIDECIVCKESCGEVERLELKNLDVLVSVLEVKMIIVSGWVSYVFISVLLFGFVVYYLFCFEVNVCYVLICRNCWCLVRNFRCIVF